MSILENEVAANNHRRRMEETSKSPVGGVIESAVTLARPALAVGAAVIASGASSATGIAVAGSVVAGLGIVDWFRKLGSAKVNENLEALGQATEDALNRVEATLRAHGTSLDEINRRLDSPDFKDGMASAALQALRTTQEDRLHRMGLILANGVKEDDLNPESLDDMMRNAMELRGSDIGVLKAIYEMQIYLFTPESAHLQQGQKINGLQRKWQDWWTQNISNYQGSKGMDFNSSCSRLQGAGLIASIGAKSFAQSPTTSDYELLLEGKKFYERIQEIEP
jgi:hypothetical protein